MLYDTHSHLDDERLYGQIEEVLFRASEAGVNFINTVGCDWRSSLLATHIAEKHSEQVRAIVGVHPHEAKDYDQALGERLFELSKSPVVVAWGEIGLDYYHDHSPRKDQQKAFRGQIAAAKERRLPIVIHDRDAHEDVLKILKETKAGENGGVLHCFSGSWEMAKECLRLGFHISFAGPLTFTNAKTPVEVAGKVPLDMVLVETDCPYLAPHPLRGHCNEPSHVSYVAAKLGEIRGLDYSHICEITTENAKKLFGIV